MPETITQSETEKETGQQVALTDPAVQAHVQQAVAAAVADKTRINRELKTEKTTVVAERDAYTGFGTADEVGLRLKELDDLKQAEAAKNAKTTPDVLKAEVDKQVAFQMAQHETRMGDVYKAQALELETFKARAEVAETDAFASWLMSQLLEASVDPKTQIFRDGAAPLILNSILPFAKRIPAAEGLPDEVRFMVNETILSGGQPDGQMGLRELLKLGRRPASEGKPTVLPGVNLSWYYPDDGAGTDSHVTDGGQAEMTSEWGKMSEDQRMDLADSDPAAAKKLIRENSQRQRQAA